MDSQDRWSALRKKRLAAAGVAPGSEQEVDRLAVFVHSAVEVLVFSLGPDVGLIHAIALRGGLEVGAATLLQFRAVGLDGTARPELPSMASPRSLISSATCP